MASAPLRHREEHQPLRYRVRPHRGVIEPGGSVTGSATLRPEPRGRAQVHGADGVRAPNSSGLETVWKEANPGEFMDSKLGCVFEMPNGNDKLDEGLRLRKAPHPDQPGPSHCIHQGESHRPLPVLLAIGAVFIGFFLGKFIL